MQTTEHNVAALALLRAEVRESGLCPYPFQVEGVNFLRARSRAILADSMGLGKALAVDEQVLCPGGWRQIGTIEVGEYVIGVNGLPTEVLGVYPQGVQQLHRVTFSDGCYLDVTAEHLWEIVDNTGPGRGNRKVVDTAWLATQKLRGSKSTSNRRWYIPLVQPAQHPTQQQEIHPYLLGALLGDGCITHGIGICFGHEAIGNAIRELGYDLVEHRCESGRAATYGISGLRSTLADLGLHGLHSYEKFIPDVYLYGDVEQRLWLLRGLMDTDGEQGRGSRVGSVGGHTSFTTTSPRLAEQFRCLIESLGGVCKIRTRKEPKYTYKDEVRIGREAFQVGFRLTEGVNPFHAFAGEFRPITKYPPKRFIESVNPVGSGEAVCIRVAASDGLFVAKNHIVTHNTAQCLLAAEARGCLKILVVCPKTAKNQWVRQVEKWLGKSRSHRVRVAEGTGPQQAKKIHMFINENTKSGPDKAAWGMLIVHYECFRRYRKDLAMMKWDQVIFDEAHRLKNRDSKTTKEAFKFATLQKQSGFWFVTGTPVINRSSEIWSLLHIIDKSKYSSYWNWVDEWLETTTKEIYTGRGLMRVKNIVGPKNPVAFKESLAPILIRREKEAVRAMAGIPDRLPDTDIYVELEPAQRKMYEQMYENLFMEVFDSSGRLREVDATNAVGRLVRLKQIALAPELTLADDSAGMTGSKLETFRELFDDARESGQKVAFFSQWGRTVRRMRLLAEQWGHHFEWFTGKDHPKEEDRWKAIDAMSNNPDCTGIMTTMGAGGESVDMVHASIVIFSDYGWTKKEHDQAIDRCDRGGQKKMVSVYRVIAEDTVESWICKMHVEKGDIFANSIPVTAILDAFQNRTLK